MSAIGIISSIIVLLAVLVCYAFIAQSITHKRQKKERLLASLKARARNYAFMLGAAATGYLPKELTLLIQRSLEQVYEQLTSFEPTNATHKEALQHVTQQMAETQRQSNSTTKSLKNTQQAKEIKACLDELYKHVFQLERKRALTRPQADAYRAMTQQVVLELTVDSYAMHGHAALKKEKFKLAAHYFDLSLKLLLREGKNGQFDQRIAQLKQILAELLPKLDSDDDPAPNSNSENMANEEWDDFGAGDKDWKKKQVYD